MQTIPTTASERNASRSATKQTFPIGSKVRVLYVDHTAAISGGEIALLNLLRNVDRQRYEPSVLLFSDGPLVARLREIGVHCDVLTLATEAAQVRKGDLGIRSLLRWRQVSQVIEQIWKVIKYCQQWHPHIIHTNSLKSDIIAGIAGRAVRIPVVWHIRDRINADYLPAKVAAVFRWLSKIIPTRVIAISLCTHQSLVGNLGDKTKRVSIVYDGVDLAAFEKKKDDDRSASDDLRVALIGRISPWKGQDIFIQAAAALQERFPKTQFLIAGSALFGETDYEQKIREMVDSYGMQNQIQFVGFVEDIPDFLRSIDVVVHASTTGEPFGQVVAEAMAAGKTVIASHGGAIPEIIEDGISGLMFPMKNTDELAGTLSKVLSSSQLRSELGVAARRRVEDRFSIKRTAFGVAAVYESLLSEVEIKRWNGR